MQSPSPASGAPLSVFCITRKTLDVVTLSPLPTMGRLYPVTRRAGSRARRRRSRSIAAGANVQLRPGNTGGAQARGVRRRVAAPAYGAAAGLDGPRRGRRGPGDGLASPRQGRDGASHGRRSTRQGRDGVSDGLASPRQGRDGASHGLASPRQGRDGASHGLASSKQARDGASDGLASPKQARDRASHGLASSKQARDGASHGLASSKQARDGASHGRHAPDDGLHLPCAGLGGRRRGRTMPMTRPVMLRPPRITAGKSMAPV
jgi:hypothetical protein